MSYYISRASWFPPTYSHLHVSLNKQTKATEKAFHVTLSASTVEEAAQVVAGHQNPTHLTLNVQ